MHDLREIRRAPEDYRKAFERRGCADIVDQIIALDQKNRELVTQSQKLQTDRNIISKAIGALMAEGKKEDAEDAKNKVASIKDDMSAIEEEQGKIAEQLHNILISHPNILSDDVPDGTDEDNNQEMRRHLTPKSFDFPAKEHDIIGSRGDMMDFERATKISGARFVYLRDDLSLLERALANFMLDIHTTEFGYHEFSPPLLVKDAALMGTGQLPKFKEDLFCTTGDHTLIPTAEVSLTNYVRASLLDIEELPLRMTAWTPCFRSEAGSAGKDTRGIIRQHQFSKVELVSVTTPDMSEIEHERMTECTETILKKLELPYRTMILCSGDTGFSARKTYDIEVWLPGQEKYREISSCSNCWDFQARRMNARFKDPNDGKNKFVHTLNGSALAVGRTIVAIMENYQNEDGSITVPEVLKPYMRGKDTILCSD
ncbi:MAG: serine--tRNA ligase [Pseudomonadota bacterium]